MQEEPVNLDISPWMYAWGWRQNSSGLFVKLRAMGQVSIVVANQGDAVWQRDFNQAYAYEMQLQQQGSVQ